MWLAGIGCMTPSLLCIAAAAALDSKTLRGLTPYEHICKVWADQPGRFRYDPTHLTSGPNT
jgi:hypothetical protein